MKRKYTKNKENFLNKYYLSRMDILQNKKVYIQDFDTWDEANKHSKHMNTSMWQKDLKGKTEIFLAVKVVSAKQQKYMVKTTLEN